jgi:hypothetical protein
MILDEITLYGSVIIIIIAILSSLQNPFFRRGFLRKIKRSQDAEDAVENEQNRPSLSVIITAQDNAYELEQHLPIYLNQAYEADFQVIVVSEKGDNDTEDVLKRFEGNAHFYHTFVPNSSRYMSKKKLAITLGVKAAKYEWVILTDASCQPASDNWLNAMAENCSDDKNLVLGISQYAEDTKPYPRFEHIHTAYYLMRKAVNGIAYRTNSPLVMFRKSEFMQQNGFSGDLDLVRGEYDFLVNKYARKSSTALELSPDTRIIEDVPTKRTWINKHIFYQATRKHLRRSLSLRLLYNLDQWAIHLNLLLILATLALSIITQRWILTASAGFALILTILLRTIIGKKAIHEFDENLSAWKVFPYEISIVWHNLLNIIRYWRADKYDFTSHKL